MLQTENIYPRGNAPTQGRKILFKHSRESRLLEKSPQNDYCVVCWMRGRYCQCEDENSLAKALTLKNPTICFAHKLKIFEKISDGKPHNVAQFEIILTFLFHLGEKTGKWPVISTSSSKISPS